MEIRDLQTLEETLEALHPIIIIIYLQMGSIGRAGEGVWVKELLVTTGLLLTLVLLGI
jgi:hypothetical protein